MTDDPPFTCIGNSSYWYLSSTVSNNIKLGDVVIFPELPVTCFVRCSVALLTQSSGRNKCFGSVSGQIHIIFPDPDRHHLPANGKVNKIYFFLENCNMVQNTENL